MNPMFVWSGYGWMNGQPWGIKHPNPKYQWYADETEAMVLFNDNLMLDINNQERYFDDIDQTKKFGCGYISTCDTFLYGDFHFEYILPIGIHLWPAIWLSGLDSWPPEIDIVEGWSGEGYLCKNQPNYKRFPLFNNIHPGVFYGIDNTGNPYGKGYGSLGSDKATYSWLQKLDGKVNTCDLHWREDNITAYYNGHKVMDIKDETILSGLRSRMYVCLDNAAGNDFTQDDYEHYKKKGSPFVITKFTYKP